MSLVFFAHEPLIYWHLLTTTLGPSCHDTNINSSKSRTARSMPWWPGWSASCSVHRRTAPKKVLWSHFALRSEHRSAPFSLHIHSKGRNGNAPWTASSSAIALSLHISLSQRNRSTMGIGETPSMPRELTGEWAGLPAAFWHMPCWKCWTWP